MGCGQRPTVTLRAMSRPSSLWWHTATITASAVFAFPLVAMAAGSLRGRGVPPPRGVELVPTDPTLEAYRLVFELLPVGTYVRNSLIVVALAVPLTVLVASLAGFGIRLLPPTRRRLAVAATIGVLLVPVTAVWATRFELFRLAGVVDTFVPLVALALLATNPFLVLVYAWAFGRVEDDQLEAAALDGAGAWRSWLLVGLPQVRAATLAVVVLAFTFHWANFIDPLLYLNSQSNYTIPLGLRLLQQLNPTDWPLLLAAATLATLPTLVVFGYGQRFFLHDPARDLRTTP